MAAKTKTITVQVDEALRKAYVSGQRKNQHKHPAVHENAHAARII